MNQELIRKIEEFDPTASEAVGAVSKIASRLKGKKLSKKLLLIAKRTFKGKTQSVYHFIFLMSKL